jgi:integrase/recombinase XerD
MNLQLLIEQYIEFQRALGSPCVTNAIALRAFGRVMGDKAGIGDVRPEHVDAFLGKMKPVTLTWHGKHSRLRTFFQYAVSRGYIDIAPLPAVIPKRPAPFVPYIYTREELSRLLHAADSDERSRCLEPVTIRTLVLLLYGAGMRLREATNLTCVDVELNRSVLTIRHTKFDKTRLVPIGAQLREVLAQYAAGTRKRPAEAPFFITRMSTAVKPDTLEHNFRILCDRAGIRRTDGAEQPRLHDLRHTFAVHRLTSWYRQGADVQRLLHLLSVYLGHVHIRDTQVYLTITPELLHEAGQRFERYAGKEHHRD